MVMRPMEKNKAGQGDQELVDRLEMLSWDEEERTQSRGHLGRDIKEVKEQAKRMLLGEGRAKSPWREHTWVCLRGSREESEQGGEQWDWGDDGGADEAEPNEPQKEADFYSKLWTYWRVLRWMTRYDLHLKEPPGWAFLKYGAKKEAGSRTSKIICRAHVKSKCKLFIQRSGEKLFLSSGVFL